MHYFGAHYDAEEIIHSLMKIKSDGGNLVQIFITGQKNRYDKDKIALCKKYMYHYKMKIVIHSSYTHNIARYWDEYSWWINNIKNEIEIAHKLNALGIVLHFGKKLELTIQEAFNNMYTSLIYINQNTLKYNDVKIFLETSTGQGTELCYKLEELAQFYKKITNHPALKNRIKLCVDTCHIFSAGYDIRTHKKIDEYLKKFDQLIGIENIGLIHLNDSFVKLGEKKDRHQSIGRGYIGKEGLKYFFDYFYKKNIPIVLETSSQYFYQEIKFFRKVGKNKK